LYRFGAADATIGAEAARLSAPKSGSARREELGSDKQNMENSG
jgi:gas vesicle protein